MRLSQLFFATLRDDPADAEMASHRLLLRAGYVRQIGTGIYSLLPLGWRVTRKVDQVTLPDTLQGVIMARLDRLDEDVKQLLKVAVGSLMPASVPPILAV